MELQPPSASSILARRGIPRPVLRRNQSSFTTAITKVETSKNVDISKALEIVSLDPSQKDTVKQDLKLIDDLKSEQIPATPSVEKVPALLTPNRYEAWECAFGSNFPVSTPSSVPSKPENFLEAVGTELKTIDSIKGGLARYIQVIRSGEHQVFAQSFLDSQSKATSITISQLEEIEGHLKEVVVGMKAELEKEDKKQNEEIVPMKLQEAFRYAKPWVARTRAIMINSHVFYKINYALAADDKTTRI